MELISREDAMRLLKEDLDASRSRGDDERADACLLHYIEISNLPALEERKEGRWIDKGRDDDVYDIKGVKTWATKGMCSECGFTTWFIESHMCYAYCPQCGSYNATKMKGE